MLELLDGDQRVRAEVTRRRLARVLVVTAEALAVRKQITAMVAGHADHVAAIYGAGPDHRGPVPGRGRRRRPLHDPRRVRLGSGTAPLAASSGRTVRHRLNRGGNRRLNHVLYLMAITQARASTEGRAHYDRKRAEGKTAKEAIRCLKRQLSDQVVKAMRADVATARAVEDVHRRRLLERLEAARAVGARRPGPLGCVHGRRR